MATDAELNLNFRTRVLESLRKTGSSGRWEQLIVSLLRRLELDPEDRIAAERDYLELANAIAAKLGIGRHDVDVHSQGSMCTQTTIRPSRNAKFDLDVVVKLSGPRYQDPDPEVFFKAFGQALEGNEGETGKPEPRRRCWKLPCPNKRYYFDVTPAVADVDRRYGACLRVRDPQTSWSPSNPREFAEWFCERAKLRFNFKAVERGLGAVEARKAIEPLPKEPVGIDDILRRTIQLLKLHRDNLYFFAAPEQKSAMPISVIIVTLATHAFEEIWRTRRDAFSSPIEVVLAVVADMPDYIRRDAQGRYQIPNPELPTENFADRWNNDKLVRAREFKRWHNQLEVDLEALLTDEYSASTEAKLLSVFGQDGVDAWLDSLERSRKTPSLLKSLAATVSPRVTNPTTVTPVGRRTNTLA